MLQADGLRGGPVRVRSGPVSLAGDLRIPDDARAIVIFAHAGGSSRYSERDRALARIFRDHGLATLMFDLLTDHEAAVDLANPQLRFDHSLLAGRVVDALEWVESSAYSGWRVGLFGSSSGAAAALIAAARRPQMVSAIVSRGGRTDMADQLLGQVAAPTLMIVGGDDTATLARNEQAREQVAAEIAEIRVIAGASHLFEEKGKIDEVGRLAADWFVRHLTV